MCPDRQILSVYLDGELPSPWKEKLESHLVSCPGCGETLRSWERVSLSLREGEDPTAKERVWAQLDARIDALRNVERNRVREEIYWDSRDRGFWRRRVTLPFPAAAALTAAAAAAFVFILTSLWFKAPVVNAPAPEMARFPIEPGVINISPVNDMSGVLQYLENTDSNDIVIIRLPESRSFQSAGEPQIIKAADYAPGRSK
ncbi:MAG: hypothetical protein LBT39_01755 [Treponema sp.]|nr:hypothetical protein [Treponema sp.]